MLTIAQCRKLVGADCALSNKELELLRDQFYSLAALAVDLYEGLGAEFRNLKGDSKAAVEERAAIIEFDGKHPRKVAERAAMALKTFE